MDWDALVDELGPMAVRISWRILGHASDVEDNVQDVFLEAYRIHRREKVTHWKGLVRRLATIGALGRLRRRRKTVPLEDVSATANGNSPDQHVIQRELEAKLRAEVAGLPEREAAVFTLRYFEGLSLAEIAESLGVKYQAAATALSRARAKLLRVFRNPVAETT